MTVTEDNSKGQMPPKGPESTEKNVPHMYWESLGNISRLEPWMQAAHRELSMKCQATPALRNTTSLYLPVPEMRRN